MGILDLGSWAVFGVCVQALAQGVRQKPLNYKPIGYLLSGAVFAGLGYGAGQLRLSQKEFLDRRVSQLQADRAARGVEFERN